MEVENLNGTVVRVLTPAELVAALAPRIDDTELAHFWIAHDDQHHPAFAIAVNGSYADVHYFAEEGGTFYRSVGPSAGLSDDGETLFCIVPGAPEPSPNQFVIPFAVAVEAATQFLLRPERPSAIQWLEL